MYRLIVVCLCSYFLFACQSDFNNSLDDTIRTNNNAYPSVDQELWTYFQLFETEAAQRGFEIDLNKFDLLAEIHEIDQEDVAGTCTYSSDNPNEITIDESFWNSASQKYKEIVVFHELGHCVLGRDHNNNANSSGICLSLMNSGLTGCAIEYTGSNKSIYLDELFYQN